MIKNKYIVYGFKWIDEFNGINKVIGSRSTIKKAKELAIQNKPNYDVIDIYNGVQFHTKAKNINPFRS